MRCILTCKIKMWIYELNCKHKNYILNVNQFTFRSKTLLFCCDGSANRTTSSCLNRPDIVRACDEDVWLDVIVWFISLGMSTADGTAGDEFFSNSPSGIAKKLNMVRRYWTHRLTRIVSMLISTAKEDKTKLYQQKKSVTYWVIHTRLGYFTLLGVICPLFDHLNPLGPFLLSWVICTHLGHFSPLGFFKPSWTICTLSGHLYPAHASSHLYYPHPYNSGLSVPSWFICTLLGYLYPPRLSVPSWVICNLLGYLYPPGLSVPSWFICTLLVYLYPPGLSVPSWFICTRLVYLYPPGLFVPSWVICTHWEHLYPRGNSLLCSS